MKFTIDDNIFLDRTYVENLKREYKGMYYERFIKGMWVAAEGLIYRDFNERMIISRDELTQRLERRKLQFVCIGVDYGGNKSASVFCLTGFDEGFENVYVLDEYYDSANKSSEHLIEKFAEYCAFWRGEYAENSIGVTATARNSFSLNSFRNAVNIEVKTRRKKPVNTRIICCAAALDGQIFCLRKMRSHARSASDSGLGREQSEFGRSSG